jgi:uncharacterized protein (TIGR02679 family)
MPAAAQRTLLIQLARAGACLRYHGDFDWPGVGIGNHVIRQYGAHAWRFGAEDYVAAVQSGHRVGSRLDGRETPAVWDQSLAPAMQAHRQAIAEERVADVLLGDLELSTTATVGHPSEAYFSNYEKR